MGGGLWHEMRVFVCMYLRASIGAHPHAERSARQGTSEIEARSERCGGSVAMNGWVGQGRHWLDEGANSRMAFLEGGRFLEGQTMLVCHNADLLNSDARLVLCCTVAAQLSLSSAAHARAWCGGGRQGRKAGLSELAAE